MFLCARAPLCPCVCSRWYVSSLPWIHTCLFGLNLAYTYTCYKKYLLAPTVDKSVAVNSPQQLQYFQGGELHFLKTIFPFFFDFTIFDKKSLWTDNWCLKRMSLKLWLKVKTLTDHLTYNRSSKNWLVVWIYNVK